jgi:hypothetical protein
MLNFFRFLFYNPNMIRGDRTTRYTFLAIETFTLLLQKKMLGCYRKLRQECVPCSVSMVSVSVWCIRNHSVRFWRRIRYNTGLSVSRNRNVDSFYIINYFYSISVSYFKHNYRLFWLLFWQQSKNWQNLTFDPVPFFWYLLLT